VETEASRIIPNVDKLAMRLTFPAEEIALCKNEIDSSLGEESPRASKNVHFVTFCIAFQQVHPLNSPSRAEAIYGIDLDLDQRLQLTVGFHIHKQFVVFRLEPGSHHSRTLIST
jgi:hypothetical protein